MSYMTFPQTHMKNNKCLAVAISLSAILLLSGCSINTSTDTSSSGESISPLPAISQTEPVQTENSPPTSVSKDDNLIPKATSEMFDLSPLDAALFDGALTQDTPYSSGAGVTFPYVGIYDEYEENGKLNVICSVAYMRYNADATSENLTFVGTIKTYGRAVLEKNEGGTYVCSAFDIVGDGAGYAKKLQEFCGPLASLADKILNGDVYPTNTFPDDLLSLYREKTKFTIDNLKEG